VVTCVFERGASLVVKGRLVRVRPGERERVPGRMITRQKTDRA